MGFYTNGKEQLIVVGVSAGINAGLLHVLIDDAVKKIIDRNQQQAVVKWICS